jgi:glycosyltransferase involved in cell wall biosynthesis
LVENLDVQNTILSVGYSKRDWKTLIRAFDDVKDKSVVLKIIGRNDLILNNQNIILEKYIPINQLIEEIRKCKFVVVPLEYFNYSFGQMTVLQAMSLGKAVIASKVPSLEDYIIDGETGLFYESGNADDLSNKISFLLNNNDLIVKLGVNSRKAIEQKFNEKEMAKEIHNFLNLILNHNFK